ncbi:MAG: tetratricopeptide repeat protein [Acidobacteriota bacterium]|nr:tetratricopeptide repeat protein [Acidobacteriota bacterium]
MKIRSAVTVFFTVFAFTMVPVFADAQAAGRVSVKLVDVDGKPIQGVTITVTTSSLENYRETKETNKKGRFLVAHTDATLTYTYKMEKEGYETRVEKVRPPVGGVSQATFVMKPAGSSGAGGQTQGAQLSGTAANVYNQGAEAQNAGDLDTAAERYAKAAELDPTLAAPVTGLAAVYFLQGNFGEAAAAAEKAVALDPSDSRALQIRYEAYRRAGDPRAKEAAAALQASGGDSDAAGRVYNEAVDAFQSGDRATARKHLEDAISLDGGMIQPHVLLAAVCGEQGDLECADRELAATFALDPDNALAVRLAYEIAVVRGDSEVEMKMATKLVVVDPEYAGDKLFTRGVEHYDANRFDQAIATMNLVLQAGPDDPRALFILGMAFFNNGDAETAKANLERFVELAPDDPDAAIAKELLSYGQ